MILCIYRLAILKKSRNQRLFGVAISLPLNLMFVLYKAYN